MYVCLTCLQSVSGIVYLLMGTVDEIIHEKCAVLFVLGVF
jgi:hypothetical protein